MAPAKGHDSSASRLEVARVLSAIEVGGARESRFESWWCVRI
jgi:hypothetical protein